MGAQIANGIGVSLYNAVANEQLEYLLNHCEARTIVVGSVKQLEVLNSIKPQLEYLENIILLDDVFSKVSGDYLNFEDCIKSKNYVSLDTAIERTDPDHLATLIYTSGTTGLPKGVMLTHRNVTYTVEILLHTLAKNGIDPTNYRVVSYLPMAHIAERVVSHYAGMACGFELTTCPDPGLVVQYLASVKPNLLFAVPRIWEKAYATINSLIEDEDRPIFEKALEVGWEVSKLKAKGEELPDDLQELWDKYDQEVCLPWRMLLGLDECHVAVSGAAPLPKKLFRFFRSLGLPLSEIYGLSETCGPLSWEPVKVQEGKVGRPVVGMEAKLDPEGEILVKGGNIFLGYHKQPDKTEEEFEDGWYKTGDIGAFDEDGYLSVIDRKKELIVTAGGKNVAPTYLEGILKTSPMISQVCVVGEKKPFIAALISLDAEGVGVWASKNGISDTNLKSLADQPKLQEEISKVVAELNSHVSHAEGVKKFLVIGEEWTVESGLITPTMKLKRKVVLEKYKDEIEAFYTR